MTVSLEGVSISAACPGDVTTDQNAVIQGMADYSLVNRGSNDAMLDVFVELVDSVGNRSTESHTNEVIVAGEQNNYHSNLFLQVAYDKPGWIAATMHVSVPGAVGGDQSADCNFIVNDFSEQALGIRLTRPGESGDCLR